MPDPILRGLDLVERSAGRDAVGALVDDQALGTESRVIVALLEQQPALVAAAVFAAAAANQIPGAVQLLAVKLEFQMAFGVALVGIALRRPGAAVPEHHRARAVLLGRDHALEFAVFERMILDMHRQPLVVRVEARPLGYRPAKQDAVQLEAEIIVETRGRMLLDHEAQGAVAALADLALGLGGDAEVALLPILFERHGLSGRLSVEH